MEEQFRVIMDALAEIDRQANEDRATLDAVRMYVANAVVELKSMKRQYEYAALGARVIRGLQELLRAKAADTPKLTLVKP